MKRSHVFALRKADVTEDAAGGPGGFTAYASVFGVKDLQGDVVEPGAFAGTIERAGADPLPLLWQHDTWAPVGIITAMAEDEYGLKVEGEFADTAAARDARALLKQGALRGLSIGYMVVKAKSGDDDANHLLEIDLLEVSVVTFPANPLAVATEVKAGRRISAATRAQITTAIEALTALLDDLDDDAPPDPAVGGDAGDDAGDKGLDLDAALAAMKAAVAATITEAGA